MRLSINVIKHNKLSSNGESNIKWENFHNLTTTIIKPENGYYAHIQYLLYLAHFVFNPRSYRFFIGSLQVLLVTSSRRPDNWIVPGGGVEPNEEPSNTAIREVLEEAGVVGTLGRCLGMFEVSTLTRYSVGIEVRFLFLLAAQNYEHKHRTKVFVMHVTEELADWEDSRNMDRKRQWFSIDEALQQLALHKPIQRRYLQQLKNSKNIAATIQQSSNNTDTAINLPPSSTMHLQPTTN